MNWCCACFKLLLPPEVLLHQLWKSGIYFLRFKKKFLQLSNGLLCEVNTQLNQTNKQTH